MHRKKRQLTKSPVKSVTQFLKIKTLQKKKISKTVDNGQGLSCSLLINRGAKQKMEV